MRSMLRAIVGVAVCVTPSAAFGAATEWQVAVLPKDRALVQSDFALAPTTPEPSANDLKDGEALFAMVYSSVDAATRVWLDGGGDAQGWGFFGKFQKKPGDTMLSFGAVLRVVASRHPQWQVGDMGVGASQIKSLLILDPEKAKLRKALGTIPPSHELSILGTTTGLTAHLAIDKLAPAGDAGVVYVSAAAGGVGLLAIQLFKLRGATKIIGSSGSDDKVRMLQSKYGIEAFNYKRQSVGEALAALAPDGVDIFFDNVGGATLDQALLQMRKFGTVITCGAVSEYSSDQTTAARNGAGSVRNMHAISDRSLSLRGFIIPDFAADFAAARTFLADQIMAGNLITEESIFSWDEFGAAHAALHAGLNTGKVLVAGPMVSTTTSRIQTNETAQDVVDFVVSAGAELGRDASKVAWSLVHDHWFESIDAFKEMPTAQLVSLGVPARLAALLADKASSYDYGKPMWRATPAATWSVPPKPKQEFPKPISVPATAGAAKIVETMLEHGYCVVTGMADHMTTARLRVEMDQAGFLFKGTKGSWSGEDTLRNAAVVLGKSPTAQQLAMDDLSLDVVNRVLSPYTKKIKLGVATRIMKVPGKSNNTYQAPRQVLHRDDYQFAASDWPFKDGFRPEFLVGVMWAANEFTATNGATNVVPGSHRWAPSEIDGKRPAEGGGGGGAGIGGMGGGLPDGTQIVPGAMPEGSALFYLGSTLHGAGNHDGISPPRDGLIFIYYLGWLNGLVNFHFGIPHEIQKEMPDKLQDLLGHAHDGTDYDHPWIKGPLYTLPYQGAPGTLSSLTNADRVADGRVGSKA